MGGMVAEGRNEETQEVSMSVWRQWEKNRWGKREIDSKSSEEKV